MTKQLKTVNIKGKQYVEVNERLKYFRENYIKHSLTTEIIELTDKRVVLRASIKNEGGVLVAQGMAYEVHGEGFINKTSYIENCETSAWGRALANFGIGLDGGVSSAEEVKGAIDVDPEHIQAIAQIKTLSHLEDYWKENKGLGKEFDQLIKTRKDQLIKANV